MSFSQHELLRIKSAVRKDEIDQITIHQTSMVMVYAGVRVVVRRFDGAILSPVKLVDELEALGVPARAKLAVERREGRRTLVPGPDYEVALKQLRRELHGDA